MSVTQGAGLNFLPLWWMHHDCWRNYSHDGQRIVNHWGHVHFFMPGYDHAAVNPSPNAFSGSQTFTFDLKEVWGPNSDDPNQQHQYNVVGAPKWYFKITEVWRRVYIQPWDLKVRVASDTQWLGRRGIRWDASTPDMSYGPFREGNGFVPYFILGARTLPIEYYTVEPTALGFSRTDRDNYVLSRARDLWEAWTPPPPQSKGDFPEDQFDLDHDGDLLFDEHPAWNKPAWHDSLYMYPTLEYQKCVKLDWQRLPGHDNPEGDGWTMEVQIPFSTSPNAAWQSPFGDRSLCLPAGEYNDDLVRNEDKLRYRQGFYTGGLDEDDVHNLYDTGPFGLPPDKQGQLMKFQDPFGVKDGVWVQQCLGGIVEAKVVMTFQHKLGGTWTQEVRLMQYVSNVPFAGKDQLEEGANAAAP